MRPSLSLDAGTAGPAHSVPKAARPQSTHFKPLSRLVSEASSRHLASDPLADISVSIALASVHPVICIPEWGEL